MAPEAPPEGQEWSFTTWVRYDDMTFLIWGNEMIIALEDHAIISIEARYNDMTFKH